MWFGLPVDRAYGGPEQARAQYLPVSRLGGCEARQQRSCVTPIPAVETAVVAVQLALQVL
jgi:hypothetical protein